MQGGMEEEKEDTTHVIVGIWLGHSRKDCNTGPTRGESRASPGHLACVQKSV